MSCMETKIFSLINTQERPIKLNQKLAILLVINRLVLEIKEERINEKNGREVGLRINGCNKIGLFVC